VQKMAQIRHSFLEWQQQHGIALPTLGNFRQGLGLT
jgi:hypothetical protein